LERIRGKKGRKVKEEALCGPLKESPPLLIRLLLKETLNYNAQSSKFYCLCQEKRTEKIAFGNSLYFQIQIED